MIHRAQTHYLSRLTSRHYLLALAVNSVFLLWLAMDILIGPALNGSTLALMAASIGISVLSSVAAKYVHVVVAVHEIGGVMFLKLYGGEAHNQTLVIQQLQPGSWVSVCTLVEKPQPGFTICGLGSGYLSVGRTLYVFHPMRTHLTLV